tara:strand:- start:2893 stop:3600 length:708 start_codon:yes stop_codon:yes gene_type:complete
MSYIHISQINNESDNKNNASIEIDYNGNVYILYNNTYYIISLEQDNINGLELIKIDNSRYYQDMYNENKHLFGNMMFGNILSGETTLSGKVHSQLNDMTQDEKDIYSLKNNYDFNNTQFIENTYFRVHKNESDENEDENILFHLNGIDIKNEHKGLTLSKLLIPYSCSFDTIYIDGEIISKNVISSSERIDGYCSSRLTIYSSGYFRCNFIDKVILSKLYIDDTNLVIKVNNINQ